MDEIELVRDEDCATRGPDKGAKSPRLTDDEKKLLKESRKAIKFMEKLKTDLVRDQIERDKIEDRIAKANRVANERNRRLELIHSGHSVDEVYGVVRQERIDADIITNRDRKEEEAKMKSSRVEKRVVCGKARSCELKDGVVSKVYDIKTKIWMPLDEFKEKYENIKVDVEKEVKVEAPQKITITTTASRIGSSTSGIGSDGTATVIPEIKTNVVSISESKKIEEEKIDNVKVKEGNKTDDVKVKDVKVKDVKVKDMKVKDVKVKEGNKSEKKVEHANIIDEYVNLLYMND